MISEYELGRSNQEILKVLVQRVISDAAEIEGKPEAEGIVDEVEKFIGGLPRLHRMGLLTFLRLLDMGPIALGFRHAFVRLSRDDQLKYLRSLETSRNYAIRGIIQALKGMVLLVYFSDPEAEKAVGYYGDCLLSAQASRSGA